MSRAIKDDEWQEIDEDLFFGRRIPALNRVVVATGYSMRESTGIITCRFEKLRSESPERFRCDLNTYWDNFDPSWDSRGIDFI